MERAAWPKNLSSSRKQEIQELLHGQNPTKKLRHLFDAHSQTGNDTQQPLFGEDLIVNTLRSFSNTPSLSSSSESFEVLQVPTNACVRSEVSEGSESISSPVPRWSLIAGRLPGRTDNEIKNYWNSQTTKKINQEEKHQNKAADPAPRETFPPTSQEVVRADEERGDRAVRNFSDVDFNINEFFDFTTEGSYGLEWVRKFLELDELQWVSK